MTDLINLDSLFGAPTAAPKFQAPSWEAKFQGRTLGYFATAEEAEACVDAARAEAEADRDAE